MAAQNGCRPSIRFYIFPGVLGMPLQLTKLTQRISPRSMDSRAAWIRRIVCLFTLLLIASCWPLWTAQDTFPQIPLTSAAAHVPEWLQQVVLACAVLGLVGGLIDLTSGRIWRISLLLFSGSMVALWLIDQHRMQPWAYEAVLLAIVISIADEKRTISLGRLLTLSIYFYSAVSKLDYTFLHSLGQQFTQALLQLVGQSSVNWTDQQRVLVALLFPLGEIATATLLSFPRTRAVGCAAASAMHGLLLLALGPLGMNQLPAVLIWNVQFILLAWLLFGGSANGLQKTVTNTQATPRWRTNFLATGVILLAVLFPLLEPFGLCDHWRAWGLYSPQSSRAFIFLEANDIEQLPEELRMYAAETSGEPGWRQFRLDRWSLAILRVPLYPQARFQLGVALATADKLPEASEVRVEIYTAADRFTGQREKTTLYSRQQIQEAAAKYWVNALPASR